MDLFDGKVDQHTSDLGGLLLAGDFLDVFKDVFSNLGLVVGVRLGDSRQQEDTLLGVQLLHGHLSLSLSTHHHVGGLARHGHGRLGHLTHHLSRHSHVHWHARGHLSGERTLCHSHGHSLHLRSALVSGVSHWASSHSSLMLLSKLRLDELEDLVEEGVDLRLVEKVHSVPKTLLLVVLEVGLVTNFFGLSFPNLLDLVVVDVKQLSVEGRLVELCLGLRSILRVFEADEGVDLVS